MPTYTPTETLQSHFHVTIVFTWCRARVPGFTCCPASRPFLFPPFLFLLSFPLSVRRCSATVCCLLCLCCALPPWLSPQAPCWTFRSTAPVLWRHCPRTWPTHASPAPSSTRKRRKMMLKRARRASRCVDAQPMVGETAALTASCPFCFHRCCA